MTAKDRTAEQTVTQLVCRIGVERYALPFDAVAEVTALGALALPPRSSPALLGAMNLRGVVHRVFDLGRLMGLDVVGLSGGHVVILRLQNFPTGLRVDQAEGIATIRADRLIDDVTTHQNRFTRNLVDGLLILNLDKIRARIHGQA